MAAVRAARRRGRCGDPGIQAFLGYRVGQGIAITAGADARSSNSTVPVLPSARTLSPSWNMSVPQRVFTTAGMPNSRAIDRRSESARYGVHAPPTAQGTRTCPVIGWNIFEYRGSQRHSPPRRHPSSALVRCATSCRQWRRIPVASSLSAARSPVVVAASMFCMLCESPASWIRVSSSQSLRNLPRSR
jgi:hypothetical protein